MCRSTFSTTTIASSTTMPMASTRPKSDSVLSEKPSAEHHGERADQRDRHRDQRNDRRAPRLQEDHDDDARRAGSLRTASRRRRGSTRARRPSGRRRCRSRRPPETTASAVSIVSRTCDRRLDRVDAGPLEDADGDRRLVVEQAAQRVAVRAELDAADVAHARDLPVGRRADDDVARTRSSVVSRPAR